MSTARRVAHVLYLSQIITLFILMPLFSFVCQDSQSSRLRLPRDQVMAIGLLCPNVLLLSRAAFSVWSLRLFYFSTHTPLNLHGSISRLMCCNIHCRWWSWQHLPMKATTHHIFAQRKSLQVQSIWMFMCVCARTCMCLSQQRIPSLPQLYRMQCTH